MAISNPPNASLLTASIGQVNKGNLNPLKRGKPNDTPDSSPTASATVVSFFVCMHHAQCNQSADTHT